MLNLLLNTGICKSVAFRQRWSGHAKSMKVRYLNVRY